MDETDCSQDLIAATSAAMPIYTTGLLLPLAPTTVLPPLGQWQDKGYVVVIKAIATRQMMRLYSGKTMPWERGKGGNRNHMHYYHHQCRGFMAPIAASDTKGGLFAPKACHHHAEVSPFLSVVAANRRSFHHNYRTTTTTTAKTSTTTTHYYNRYGPDRQKEPLSRQLAKEAWIFSSFPRELFPLLKPSLQFLLQKAYVLDLNSGEGGPPSLQSPMSSAPSLCT